MADLGYLLLDGAFDISEAFRSADHSHHLTI